MSTKKLKLKTSLNTINGKAAAGKHKPLPKLKSVLTRPLPKDKHEKLSSLEVSELKDLMYAEIIKSNLPVREFARVKRICLGLGCSLRAINTNKASCVLISETIRPKFIINQIVYFAKEKNSLMPVLIVGDLETFSEKIFGIRSLVVVFPLKLPGKLGEWVARRAQRPEQSEGKDKNIVPCSLRPKRKNEHKIDFNTIYIRKEPNGERVFVPKTMVELEKEKEKSEPETKDWSGDYIPLYQKTKGEKAPQGKKADFERHKNKMLTALRRMASSIKGEESIEENNTKQDTAKTTNYVKLSKIIYEEYDDDYDFGDSYSSVRVNRIHGRPRRIKPEKRRPKKKSEHD